MRSQITILSLLIFVQFVSSQPEQLNFRRLICLKSENVPSNSTYSNNKNSLLSNLTSLSSQTLFSTFSTGSGLDRVNGLYLCRPDLPLGSCHACIIDATTKFLLQYCPNKKQAIVYYEECMIRYSNRSILATEEIEPANTFVGLFNVSEPGVFPALLNRTMEGLIAEATSPRNKLRFATGNASFTAFEELFGMVLCTRDIKREECRHCLTTAFDLIPSCCGGLAQWTMIFLPSCQLRYDTAPFIFPPPPSVLAHAPPPSVNF